MAKRGRLSRIGGRIARRGGRGDGDDESGRSAEPLPGLEGEHVEPRDAAPTSGSAGAAEPPEGDVSGPGLERPTLADLDLREGRRLSIRRRLTSLRGPRDDPAAPTLFDQDTGGRAGDVEGAGGTEGSEPKIPTPETGRGLAGRAGAAASGAAAAGRGVGAAARDGGQRLREAWQGLEVTTRRRIAALGIFVAAVAAIVLVIAPLAPCWAPGGDRCPPGDDAIALVPAGAEAYVHANLDPDTDQAEAAASVTGRLPALTAQASALLMLASERAIDYRRDVAPWSGGEIALSIDAAGAESEPVLLIEAADAEGAEAFAERYLGGEVTEADVDGITVRTDRSGTATAIAGGFLIAGGEESVISTVELVRGGGETLAADPAYEETEEQLPDDRLIDAWVAPGLAGALLRGRDSGLRPFDTFVNADATQGVAAALSFGEDSAGLAVRSAQDPEAPQTDRNFFATLPPFEPSLAEQVGADALAYLGIGDPAESAEALLERAAATAPDLFDGLEDFNRRLGEKDGVDLRDGLLPELDGESALTVEPQEKPGEAPRQGEDGVLAPASTPYLAMLATDVDVDAALDELARLQAPVASAVDPEASGQAPAFRSSEIAGVEAQSLQISPVVDLTYAGWDDELVIGTSPLAVERARSDADSLADLGVYEQATEPLGDEVGLLVYLNTRSLLALGERLFLGADPAYARFAPDLRTLEGIALAVSSSETELATDLEVVVGEPIPADTEPAPIGPGPG